VGCFRGIGTYKSVDLHRLESHILERVRHVFVCRKVCGGEAGTVTFGVVGVVEEQNDSSAATPRFTTSLSEDHSLELKRTRLGAAGSH
jgi:hypothetical protein